MKKGLVFLISGLLLLTVFVMAEGRIQANQTEGEERRTANVQGQANREKIAAHPFLDEKIDYSWFRLIGIPEPLARREFIIYLCLFIAVFLIIYEITKISGIIENDWINFFIALIILLLGNYSVNTVYLAMGIIKDFSNIISFFGDFGWINVIIALAIVIGLFIAVKWGLSKIRKTKMKIEEDGIKERGEDWKTIGKIQDIKLIGMGIEGGK